MVTPVSVLGHVLVHPGVRVVDVLTPMPHSGRNVGDEVLHVTEAIRGKVTSVYTVVEGIHEQIIPMGVRSRVDGRGCYRRRVATVDVHLEVPRSSIFLGGIEPVGHQGFYGVVAEVASVEAGGVECLVLRQQFVSGGSNPYC